MSELKPCPFCGGKAIVWSSHWDAFGRCPHDFTVFCDECHASVMHFFSNEISAIEAWNRRADNPPCKVGDTVYPLNADRRFRAIIEKIEINANGLLFGWVQYDVGVDCTECWDEDLFTVDDIGKTVFLDETEYLIALKEREKV